MARKRKSLPILENILITDIAAEGKAIAKVDGMAVFVPFVVPGDVIDIQLTRNKKSYAEGKAVRFEKYSDTRSTPFCEHFSVCGGCKWQNLPYEEQLRYKHKQVIDSLERIGKVDLPDANYIMGAPQTTFYRNKLEYTFSNKRWLTEEEIGSDKEFDNMNSLGFHIPGMFDKVLNINKCWLQDDISNQIRNAIRDFCNQNDYSFFDIRKQVGMMRTLMIRNTTIGELMVIVVFCTES